MAETLVVTPAPDQTAAPRYEKPTVTVLTNDEVLRAFQVTAAQIGAAAVWWSGTCSAC